MPISAQRTIVPDQVRNFGHFGDTSEVPPLCDIQFASTQRFLQLDAAPEHRTASGLEGVLREIFPIESYDKTPGKKLSLDYLKYELGKPRYGPDECRQLRLTYGRPFRVWLRLNKEQPVEEEVYLGDMPIMIGGGEFIINGAERVVVSQLHRSPGVDFTQEMEGERRLHSCRIIPERGQLDRDQRHQKGNPERPHRPERQVFGHHAPAGHGSGLLHRRANPARLLPGGRASCQPGQPGTAGRGHRCRRYHRSGNRRSVSR